MSKPITDIEVTNEVLRLQQKSESIGQNFTDYLSGIINMKEVNYWDYVNLDILLDLQRPKTHFPDEMIFLTYHQICELYFKLVLWELEQMTDLKLADQEVFVEKLQRVIRIYENLIYSFDIILKGLDQAQFAGFRLSLFPASAFQSVQYRLIDIYSTDLHNLINAGDRDASLTDKKMASVYRKIYWKQNGAVKGDDKGSISFQKKYSTLLLQKAKELKDRNLNQVFLRNFSKSGDADLIITHLREFDMIANIKWPMAHFRGAARHLQQKAVYSGKGTSGTTWKKYLPPSSQKKIFFPDIWTEEERKNWGLSFITHK